MSIRHAETHAVRLYKRMLPYYHVNSIVHRTSVHRKSLYLLAFMARITAEENPA